MSKKSPEGEQFCWELTQVRVGSDRLFQISFHVSEVEAQIAQQNATDHGCATRLQKVRVPTTLRELVSLLADYSSRFLLR